MILLHNMSALHFATKSGIEELAVDALNVQYPDPNPRDSKGPLMMRAAASGKTEIIKLLASKDTIDFNLVDSRGSTARYLHCCSTYSRIAGRGKFNESRTKLLKRISINCFSRELLMKTPLDSTWN